MSKVTVKIIAVIFIILVSFSTLIPFSAESYNDDFYYSPYYEGRSHTAIVDKGYTFYAEKVYYNIKSYKWSSDNTNVLQIVNSASSSAKVSFNCKAITTTDVKVTLIVEYFLDSSRTSYTYHAEIHTVKIRAPYPDSVFLSKSSVLLSTKSTDTLTASLLPTNASATYSWSNSDNTVAIIYDTNNQCEIRPLRQGKTTISVQTDNKLVSECTVIVYDNDKIWVECSNTIWPTDEVRCKLFYAVQNKSSGLKTVIRFDPSVFSFIKINENNNSVVSYQLSDEAGTGKKLLTIKAITNGEMDEYEKVNPFDIVFKVSELASLKNTEIEVLTDNSKSAYTSGETYKDFASSENMSLQICAASVSTVDITGNTNISSPTQYTAVISPEYAYNKNVKWSVSDTSVATIDSNGLLTPLKNGTVKVTAISESNSNAKKTINVVVSGIQAKIAEIECINGKMQTAFSNEKSNYCILLNSADQTEFKFKVKHSGQLTYNGMLYFSGEEIAVPITGNVTDVTLSYKENNKDDTEYHLYIAKNSASLHSWDGGVVTVKPTHQQEGKKTVTCKYCGIQNVTSIAKETQHSYSSWTKYNLTQHKRSCSCGDTQYENHKWNSGTVTQTANCKNTGVKTYTCTTCGETKTETIQKTTHSWGNGVVQREATESQTGLRVYTCGICGEIKNEEIQNLTHIHNFSSVWQNDENNHWKECSCGEVKDIANHNWNSGNVIKESNCYETGTLSYSCTICGKSRTEEIPKSEIHKYGNGIVVKNPTETTTGLKVYFCELCGNTQEEIITFVNDTHTHAFDNSWKYDTDNHWKECLCGEKSELSSHLWDNGTITLQASAESDGVVVYTCLSCKTTKSDIISKDKFAESELTGTNEKQIVKGWISKEAKFVTKSLEEGETYNEMVKLINTDENQLIGVYELSIEDGNYIGNLSVSFKLDDSYNNKVITVYHKLSSGEIEIKTSVCSGSTVTISVSELSPFLLSAEKTESEKDVKDNFTWLWISIVSVAIVTSVVIVVVVVKKKKQEKKTN